MAGGRLIMTGATGFLGRHLLHGLSSEWRIIGISRGAPTQRGVCLPGNARWIQADIAEADEVNRVFSRIARDGGAEVLVHLASHYDFTGEAAPEYRRTNVEGTKNVLEAARHIGVRDVVFASSVAACDFPANGSCLTETAPPDGTTPYAASKRDGEALVAEHRDAFRGWTVRFAALYSDWCEYEPLFRFLETWLSRTPRARVLAGRGLSAIPFLHIRDAVTFVRTLLLRRDRLDPRETLLASCDGSTSHRELFAAATVAQFGERSRPIFLPRSLCRPLLGAKELVRKTIGASGFERAWMARMIDLRLHVDSSRTRERLVWAPRPRMAIVRRMPFLIQNRKAFTAEWQRRNHWSIRSGRRHDNMQIHRTLVREARSIAESVNEYVLDARRTERFAALRSLGPDQPLVDLEYLLAALQEAVRVGEKTIFQHACRSIARRRRAEGLELEEIVAELHLLNDATELALAVDPSPAWSLALYDHVTMTFQFGVDEVHDVFDHAE